MPDATAFERAGEQWVIALPTFSEVIEENPRVRSETHETVREPPLRPLKERDWDGDENTLRRSSTIENESYAAISTLYPADRSATEHDSDPEIGSYHPETGDLDTSGRSIVREQSVSNADLGLNSSEGGLIAETIETFRKHRLPFDGEVLNIVVRESREWDAWGLSNSQYAVWESAVFWSQFNAWACSEESSLGPACKPVSQRPTEWAVEHLTNHSREDRAKLGHRATADGGDGGIRIAGIQSTSTHPHRATDFQRRRVGDQAILLARRIAAGDVPTSSESGAGWARWVFEE